MDCSQTIIWYPNKFLFLDFFFVTKYQHSWQPISLDCYQWRDRLLKNIIWSIPIKKQCISFNFSPCLHFGLLCLSVANTQGFKSLIYCDKKNFNKNSFSFLILCHFQYLIECMALCVTLLIEMQNHPWPLWQFPCASYLMCEENVQWHISYWYVLCPTMLKYAQWTSHI